MNDSEVRTRKGLKPQEVADFLGQHPDFFIGKDDLLLKLTLPHQRGEAISLVERQIALLRESNLDYRRHLNYLSDTAKDNEQLFERMRKLVLMLLESRDLEQLLEAIADSLNHEFKIERHSLILFDEKPLGLPVRMEHVDVATEALGNILEKGKPVCGQFEDESLNFLFPGQEDEIGSVAIIPLRVTQKQNLPTYRHSREGGNPPRTVDPRLCGDDNGKFLNADPLNCLSNELLNKPQQLGVLALASKSPGHFQDGMGSLFTGYIGDVVSRMLALHT